MKTPKNNPNINTNKEVLWQENCPKGRTTKGINAQKANKQRIPC